MAGEKKPTAWSTLGVAGIVVLVAAGAMVALRAVDGGGDTASEETAVTSTTASRVVSPRTTTTRLATPTTTPSKVKLEDLLTPDEMAEAQFSAILIEKGVDFDASDRDELILRGRTVCVYLSQPDTSLISATAELMDTYGYSRRTAGAISYAATEVLCPEERP